MSSGFLPRRMNEKTLLSESLAVDPFEALPVEIDLMQRRLRGEQLVQVARPDVARRVRFVLEQVPIQAARFAPFLPLSELLAHEEQLFARMRELVRE